MDATGSPYEAQRLGAVQRYRILDTPPDGAFDRVTAIAARLFQVPIALVTIIDHDRIWFKSHHGLDIAQIDREPGLCDSAILQNDVYTITNAIEDPRALTNSLVRGRFGLRFYAAAPLKTQDGYNLGTLCVIDHQPRSITLDETQTLQDLAAIVMDEMEMRLSARQLVATTQTQRIAINDLYHHAPCGYHSLDQNGVFVEINATELGWLGYDYDEIVGKMRFSDVLTPEGQTTFAQTFPRFKRQGRVDNLEFQLVRADGSPLWVLINAIAEYDKQGNYVKSRSTVHNISDRKQTELALQQLNESLEATVTERTAQLTQRNHDLEDSNQALHVSNMRFRNAFDYAGIGMALVSLKGRWLEVNRSLCELTGYTETELLATSFQALTHPDDLAADLERVDQVLKDEIRHYHLEKRYRHRQGHWVWSLLSVSLVRSPNQDPLYFVAQIQDIHERKQTELALQKSQAMLLEAQAIGHLDSWEYDVATQTITWSAEKFRILGRDPTLGEPTFAELLRIHHPEDRELLHQAVSHTLATGEPYNLRLKCTRSDGSRGYIEDRGQAERNAQGEIVRLFGITQDITERVQAEQALQESKERYRSVVLALSEGIILVQADGKILTCNDSAARIIGVPNGRILGRSITMLKGKLIQPDGTICPVADYPPLITLRTGNPITKSILGLVKPDDTTWISVNTQPLIHAGDFQPYAVVVSFTDVTESRRSEVAALRRRAQQERLLSDIAQRIRQTLDLGAILNTTVTEVQHFLQTDWVIIYRLEPDGSGTIIAEAETAGLPSLLGRKIEQMWNITHATAYQEGSVQICADIHTAMQQGVETPCPLDHLTQARAKITVPIVQNQRLWGLLFAYHCQGPRYWEPAELDVLKRLATQLAIAIQQSQLYQHIQAVNHQLEHLATHDDLTQLANRRSFDTYLKSQWNCLARDQAPLSLILGDIDHFKHYNDTYGHPAGDACLQQVAQALGQVVQRPADLVARYGGEEFAIVLPATDMVGAEAIARAIQKTLRHLALFHGASPIGPHITLSLGIASLVPTLATAPQELIDQADAALYAAKNQGRDRYCIAPPPQQKDT